LGLERLERAERAHLAPAPTTQVGAERRASSASVGDQHGPSGMPCSRAAAVASAPSPATVCTTKGCGCGFVRAAGACRALPASGFVRQPGRGLLVQGAAGRARRGENVLQPARGAALGFVRSCTRGEGCPRGGPAGGCRQGDGGAWRMLDRLRRLGLAGFERAQRAPELGHGRAAIAQQRLERPRPRSSG
jgi:hypothetical protein